MDAEENAIKSSENRIKILSKHEGEQDPYRSTTFTSNPALSRIIKKDREHD